jgi:type 1 fimbria pilin
MLSGGLVGDALALCSLSGINGPGTFALSQLPASLTLRPAPIGEVMASATLNASGNTPLWYCTENISYRASAITTLRPWDEAAKIHASGIPGVGLRFSSDSRSNWPTRRPIPYDVSYVPWGGNAFLGFPNEIVVDFIRTGIAVGRGDILPFDYKMMFSLLSSEPRADVVLNGTQLRTRLVNNSYYTSCYNPSSDPTVDMGRPYVALIKQGQVNEQNFSVTIRCDGLNPTTKPPVKIYFEGSSPRDGLLNLTGVGQPDVAKGVGIALTDDNGTALPFAKARALPLTWQSSAPDAELYRFDAKAKYIATGGEITPGKADATMTYVLEYN